VVAAVAAVAVIVVLLVFTQTATRPGILSGDASGVTASTIRREKLDPSLGQETAWYQDDNTGADAWFSKPGEVENGLKYYFDKTGVRPYLLINDQTKSAEVMAMTDAERFAYVQERYDELFRDDAHALFVISDNGEGDWRYDDYIGAQAKVVVDQEAVGILYDYLDYYWGTDSDEETLFSESFRKAADRMMSDPSAKVSPWIVLTVVAGVIILAAILFGYLKKRKQQKLKEMELTRNILETPIDQIPPRE
jgi:hypothetical protein